MDDMLGTFLEEAREFMSSIEDCLLSMESGGVDSELINEVFRAVHTVKGGSGFLGLAEIGALSHKLEDVLSLIRTGKLTPDSKIINSLLKGVDILNEMLNSADQGKSINAESIISDLQQILSNEQKAKSAPDPVPESPAQPGAASDSSGEKIALPAEVIEKADKSKYLYRVVIDFKSIRKSVNIKEQKDGLLAFIKNACAILHSDVPLEKINELKTGSATLYIETIHEKEIFAGVLGIPDESVEPVDLSAEKKTEKIKAATAPEKAEKPKEAVAKPKSAEPKEAPAPKSSAASSKTASESVRMRVDLLDKIMTLAGEIVLSRNQLFRKYSGKEDNALLITHSHQVTELQENVMKTRLQAVGIVFTKYKRIVRDMAIKLGKEINLHIIGEDVELDRSIIDSLSDPLTHLIRNCCDHALEAPEEREKNGKSRAGNIHLRAFHQGGNVMIEVEDDGRGIDHNKIKQKAIEKELITEEKAAQMDENELVNLIMYAGFSTVEKISDVSGRGVGMDVVKTSFEKLGGSFDLNTTLGKGTNMSVRLPLTLAIIPSLIVTVKDFRFAVPQVDVVEIVRIKRGEGNRQIESVRGQAVFRLRGKLLPVVRLADTLDIKRSYGDLSDQEEKDDRRARILDRRDEEGPPVERITKKRKTADDRRKKTEIQRLLVVCAGVNYFGLLVDTILDPEEIVVKPLPQFIKSSKMFSAATIMGDGQVAMILNIDGIVSLTGFKFQALAEKASEYEEELKRKSLMEQQSIIIFNNADTESFSLPLAMVGRVEKIDPADIELVGKKEFIQLRDESVSLVHLENHMEVKPGNLDKKELFVLIPKSAKYPVGIIATKIVDVFETSLAINTESLAGKGLLGTCILNKRMTMMLDLYALLEMAAPEKYKNDMKKVTDAKKSGYKILLVEDTPFFRTLAKNFFESAGFEVTLAVDGKEGLKTLNDKNPDYFDIVVSDIEMPVMNGYELVQNIKSSEKLRHLPVMALTALSSPENLKKGTDAGFDAYEVKIEKEKLVGKVHDLISWSKQGAKG